MLHKAFANNSSANIKLAKTQRSKIVPSGGFLWRFLKTLLKTGQRLIKNVLKPLTKSVSITLGFSASESATNAVIQKQIHVSGTKVLITSNEKVEDTMKIVKSFEESNLLISNLSVLDFKVAKSTYLANCDTLTSAAFF